MKTTSWEIIVAGFLFVGVAIYLIEQNSNTPVQKEEISMADSLRHIYNQENLHVIKLKNLKELEKLKELEQLENLKSLKNITAFLPAEFQSEFEAELEQVIQEFEDQNVEVHVDREKGTISIDKAVPRAQEGWTSISPGVFAFTKEFDATDLKETELSLPFGSIVVTGTSAPMAKLSIQASGLPSTREELQSKIELNSMIESGKAFFTILSKEPKSADQNIHLQATLSIPQNSKVQFSTDGGHISSENIHGNQLYKTMGGHIKLKDLSGEVNVQSGGGHIAVSRSSGTINLESKGGNIRAEKSEGDLTMNTLGGNLFAIDFNGTVQAITKGGNIELRFLELKGESRASTGAGSIAMWIPKDTNTSLELLGNTIEISDTFNFEGSSSDGKAMGSIGNDGASLFAKTGYGNITLRPLQ